MKEISERVVDLETCKRLKDIGFPKTFWSYYWRHDLQDEKFDLFCGGFYMGEYAFSAPIFEEVWEFLPKSLVERKDCDLFLDGYQNVLGYYDRIFEENFYLEYDSGNLATKSAKLLLRLYKDGVEIPGLGGKE